MLYEIGGDDGHEFDVQCARSAARIGTEGFRVCVGKAVKRLAFRGVELMAEAIAYLPL